MNLVDRVNRQRSLTAMSRTLRSGRIVANTGVPTTTYSYDANGNLLQAGGWNYVWDYLNRMLASWLQQLHDDVRLRSIRRSRAADVDDIHDVLSQQVLLVRRRRRSERILTRPRPITSGTAIPCWRPSTSRSTTGQRLAPPSRDTSIPIILGSTNAVTDQNGNLVQLSDYYPYGATRVATTTYPTNEKRQYIGQFSDAQTSLNYFNARFYDSARGQFTSQDPVFLGNPADQNLRNPQSLNSYSYANDNPITNKDPKGDTAIAIPLAIIVALLYVAVQLLYNAQTQHAIQSAIYNAPAPSAMVQPLPEKQQSPIQGLPIFPQSIPQSKPVSTIPINGPAVSTPYTITPTNFSNAAPSINFAQSGKTTIIEKPGDINTAEDEFLNLNPVNIKTDPKNGTIYGNLPDGGTANVRPQSTDGRPTLEIQHPNGDTTKIRYGDN